MILLRNDIQLTLNDIIFVLIFIRRSEYISPIGANIIHEVNIIRPSGRIQLKILSKDRIFWWRRGESDPRPKVYPKRFLRAQAFFSFPVSDRKRRRKARVASFIHVRPQSLRRYTFTAE